MILLLLGVILWSAVHFLPSLGPGLKTRLIGKFGKKNYRILFALLVVTSILLMIFGWRSSDPRFLYALGSWTSPVTTLLVLCAFILMGATNYPTRIKRFIRHPQLSGLAVWAIAHLISNGDSRSLILFGGLGLWALAEIFLISAREGTWIKPEAPSLTVELRGLAISFVIFFAAMALHPWFAGVPVIAR